MSRFALGRRSKCMAGIVVATSWLVAACGSSASPQAGASASVSASAGTSTAPSTIPSSSTTDPGTPVSPTGPSTVPPSCEMYGFPGVSFVTAPTGQGQQVGAAALHSGAFAKVRSAWPLAVRTTRG